MKGRARCIGMLASPERPGLRFHFFGCQGSGLTSFGSGHRWTPCRRAGKPAAPWRSPRPNSVPGGGGGGGGCVARVAKGRIQTQTTFAGARGADDCFAKKGRPLSCSHFSCRCTLQTKTTGLSLGPPVVPFYPFLGEGSTTKTDYRKKLEPLFEPLYWRTQQSPCDRGVGQSFLTSRYARNEIDFFSPLGKVVQEVNCTWKPRDEDSTLRPCPCSVQSEI